MTDDTLPLPFPELLEKILADLISELPPHSLLTPEEVATFFRVWPSTIYTWINQGDLPGAFKWGGSWRIPRQTVIENLKTKLSNPS